MTTPSRTPRLIDVSHTVEHGMVTYKGLPAPIVCDFLSREASRRLHDAQQAVVPGAQVERLLAQHRAH